MLSKRGMEREITGDAKRSLEEKIASYAAQFAPDRLTREHHLAAARTLVDTHAVAVGGWFEPAPTRFRQYAQAAGLYCSGGSDRADGSAGLWLGGMRANAEVAAMANGVAGHVLDYDDVSSEMRGHPSAALWPALLALGESRDVSGARLISAFIVGFELIVKLSRGMAQEHYARGWHSTSGIGTVACAVACAHLLNLQAAAIQNAIGIAVAQTAGTRQNFGSDAKSFQAGHCNGAGVRSALLAEAGFTGGHDVLSGPGGFLDLYGGSLEKLNEQLQVSALGDQELLLSGVEVKKYPMCYAAHRALDGMLDLRFEEGVELSDVDQVRVTNSRGGLTPLIHHRPKTGLEAKFSMQYGVLAALADGVVDFQSFTDEAVLRPEIQNLLGSVTIHEQGDSLFPRWTELSVTLKNGRVLHQRIEHLRGSAAFPMHEHELLAKAADCYERGQSGLDAKAIHAAACILPDTTTRAFLQVALG